MQKNIALPIWLPKAIFVSRITKITRDCLYNNYNIIGQTSAYLTELLPSLWIWKSHVKVRNSKKNLKSRKNNEIHRLENVKNSILRKLKNPQKYQMFQKKSRNPRKSSKIPKNLILKRPKNKSKNHKTWNLKEIWKSQKIESFEKSQKISFSNVPKKSRKKRKKKNRKKPSKNLFLKDHLKN